jgi:hypothetical protein
MVPTAFVTWLEREVAEHFANENLLRSPPNTAKEESRDSRKRSPPFAPDPQYPTHRAHQALLADQVTFASHGAGEALGNCGAAANVNTSFYVTNPLMSERAENISTLGNKKMPPLGEVELFP